MLKVDRIQTVGVWLREQWFAMRLSKQVDCQYYWKLPQQQPALHCVGMCSCLMQKLTAFTALLGRQLIHAKERLP